MAEDDEVAPRPVGADLDALGVELALHPGDRIESVFLAARVERPGGGWALALAISPDPKPEWIENVGDGWRLVPDRL